MSSRRTSPPLGTHCLFCRARPRPVPADCRRHPIRRRVPERRRSTLLVPPRHRQVGDDLTHRPADLLDIVPGHSADVVADWLKKKPDDFRAAIDHVGLAAFAGYKNAATSVVPDATTVIAPSTSSPWSARNSMRRGDDSRQNFTVIG